MGLMGGDYRTQMQALLPKGAAWPRAATALWTKLLDALAEEYSRVDGRARQLLDEADPRTTVELLAAWERVAGLPDVCSGLLAETQQGRRSELVSKLVGQGGQSRSYFIEVAAALGFALEIEEFRPFRAGQAVAGQAVTNGDWRFAWRVRGPTVTVMRFRAGQSAAGEPLASWGNAGMECRLRHYRPAQTNVLFAYGPGGGDLLLLPDGSGYVLDPSGIGLYLE